jgi:hypothetical protein
MDPHHHLSRKPQSEDQEHEEWHPNPVFVQAPKSQDIFENLKGNPLALVLLGIVIGVLIVNMRPLVIKQ